MLSVRACANPEPNVIKIVLPKRLARIRRSVETKRLESLKQFHESLKKTAKEETDLVKELLNKDWSDDEEEKDSA
jgi:ribosome recycling factor